MTAKHFSDYLPTANVIVGGNSLQTLTDVSPDECAAKCSAKTACRSVNFCPESAKNPNSTCSLMEQSLADAGAERIRHPGCWNYRRLTATTAAKPVPPPPSPPGYRGASLSWLVIGMLVTGAVLGMAGLLAYGTWRARSGRTANGSLGLAVPSVRWSRQRDEE